MHDSVGSSAPQDHSRSIDPLKLKSKARLRLEVATSGIPQKALAYDTRSCDAQVTRYLGDQYPDDIPSYKVPYLTTALGPGYMEWLAIQCGGVYHHGEHAPHCHRSVTVLLGLLAKQSGGVVQQLLQDLDHHINTHQDLVGLRRLKTTVEELINDVDGGSK